MRRPGVPVVFLTNPFEICIALSITLMGARSAISGAEFSERVSDTVSSALSTIWQAGAIIGGGTVLFALLTRYKWVSRRAQVLCNAVERAGLYMIATGSSVYVVVILFLNVGYSGYVVGIMVAVTAACILRAVAIRKADRIILQNALLDEAK